MPYQNQHAPAISRLLLEGGDARARAAMASGQAWGGAVQNIGQQVTGTLASLLQQRQDAPRRAEEAAQLADAARARTERGQVRDAVRGAVDPATGQVNSRQAANAVAQIDPEAAQQWWAQASAEDKAALQADKDRAAEVGRAAAAILALPFPDQAPAYAQWREMATPKGLQLPETYNPGWLRFKANEARSVDALFAAMTPKTREVKTRKADGSETTQIVEDTPGQTFESAAPPPKSYEVTVPGANGPVRRLATEADMNAGVPEYRAPVQGPQSPVAVIGPDGQPIYVRAGDAIGRRPASNREQGRPVTSGDAGRIADLDTSLNDLNTLTRDLGVTGNVSKLGAWTPNWVTNLTGWGADAKSRQAVIDRVKQVIGKALEGGVLRKEDEIKYEKILPTIGDEPTVAKSKLEGLWNAIGQRRQTTLDALNDAGYDVGKFGARPPKQREGVGQFSVAAGGKTYTFPTQAALDAFKAEAGLK